MTHKNNSIYWTVALAGFLMLGCSRDPQKLVQSGVRYMAEGKYNEAVIELKSAIQRNPQLPEAHYQLGLAYLRLGLVAEANQELNRTVVLQPANLAAQLIRGNLLLLDHNFQEARATAELILERESS